jgi:hypothetical protein
VDTESAGYSVADIGADYEQKLQSLQADLIRQQHEQRVALAILACLLGGGGAAIWLTWPLAAIASAAGLVTLAGALALLRIYGSRQRKALRMQDSAASTNGPSRACKEIGRAGDRPATNSYAWSIHTRPI